VYGDFSIRDKKYNAIKRLFTFFDRESKEHKRYYRYQVITKGKRREYQNAKKQYKGRRRWDIIFRVT
jgi:hypothetical protein